MNNSKQPLIYSILGIVLLFIIVIGVSYAIYTFSGTGTTENVITTGSISVDFAQSDVFSLSDQYPMTDIEGLAQTEVGVFTIQPTLSGTSIINYEIGMEKLSSTLTDDDVKINLTKKIGTGDVNYVKGTDKTGVLISEFSSNKGNLSGTTISGYLLDSGSFTSSSLVTYTIKLWIDENYDLTTSDTSAGNTHSNKTILENYLFKIKAYAIQAV